MPLTREDFRPKRPTQERAIAAAAPLLLALGLAIGLAVPAWRVAASHRGEQTMVVQSFLVAMMLFVTRVSAIDGARGIFRFLQVAAMAWYVFGFCLLLGIIAYVSGSWGPLLAGILLIASSSHTLLTRRDTGQRRLLFARAVTDFLLLWVAATASFPLASLTGDAGGMASYAMLYFAFVGLLDLFGVLVPEPSVPTQPGWERFLHPMGGSAATTARDP